MYGNRTSLGVYDDEMIQRQGISRSWRCTTDARRCMGDGTSCPADDEVVAGCVPTFLSVIRSERRMVESLVAVPGPLRVEANCSPTNVA